MKKSLVKISLVTLLISNSCTILQPKEKAVEQLDYLKGSSEKMNYRDFFNGKIEGFAIKKDQDGKIINSFKVQINGSWEGNRGVVKNNYIYFDGRKDSRTWLVTIDQDGTYEAIGHDVIKPIRGEQVGNSARASYSLKNDSKSKEEILFTDKMYLIDNESMIVIQDYKKNKPNKGQGNRENYGQVIISLKKIKESE